ncbi:MAG: tRNA dihydrouridine(20/20a) synthase DusA [Rickettsiales bacterium]|nr:tRNA dihydrouridine(20/20a) synthase DusA [Rickettsiales bacterium]
MLTNNIKNRQFSIAPMMGKTDSFFCILSNLINNNIKVYTEMIHAESISRKNSLDNYKNLKNISNITLQIAGNNPKVLAKAATYAEDIGFEEINLNCGCPSSRVVSGKFGISLLKNPKLVSECVAAIKKKVSCKVSIKTRIGIEDEGTDEILDVFIDTVNQAKVSKYIIHARKAILNKISTKKNLIIPKLDYERVFRLKDKFNKNIIIINGGFLNTTDYDEVLKKVDGIMIGREAYKNPWIFNQDKNLSFEMKKRIIEKYLSILELHFKKQRFNFKALTHLYYIFNNHPGSKHWKQLLNISIRNKNLKCLFNYLRYNE